MKRILQILGSTNRAGAETMIMNLYREIDRKKYQFDFLVFSDSGGDYNSEIESLGGKVHRIKSSNPLKRMFLLKKFLISNNQYQIVHCHTNFSNAFHLLAAKKAGVKMRIAHSHNTTDKSRNKLISFFYHRISRRIINYAATNFVSCGEKASNLLFPGQDKVLIIPNSVDIDHHAKVSLENKNYLTQTFKISNDCLKLIQVGRMQSEKNHRFSIEIAYALKHKNINFKMFFVGTGELMNELITRVKNLNLEHHIVFLGLRSDVIQLMAGADIMLMPSLYEGFPVVLVESQAVGLPALISDTISEEVDLKVNCIFFESLQAPINNWIQKITTIQGASRMDNNQRKKILKNQGFDTKNNANKLIKFYFENDSINF